MVPTYMLTAKLADSSGSLFVQFPRELGEPIMNGLSAKDFQDLKERAASSGEDVDRTIKQYLADNVYFKVRTLLSID
jgi:hypothetical protein